METRQVILQLRTAKGLSQEELAGGAPQVETQVPAML